MKEILKNNTWFRTIIGIAFFAGTSWITVQSIKPMQQKIQEHSEAIAAFNQRFTSIDKQLDRIERKIDKR